MKLFFTAIIGVLLFFVVRNIQSTIEGAPPVTANIVGFSGFLFMIVGFIFGMINYSR